MSQTTHTSRHGQVPAWQPFRGPFTRWPRSADTVLAFVSFAATLSMWSSVTVIEDAAPVTQATAAVVFLVGNLALIWRRRHPFNVHAFVMLASVIAIAPDVLGRPVFALAVSLYSLGRYESEDRRSFLGVGAGVALVAVDRFVLATPDPQDAMAVLMAFVLWYVGRRIRFRGEYLRLLEERAEQLEREQSAEAEKAVNEERTRIARELHDIVAHQVSLMTVQASAAKVVAGKDPDAARGAMASVESAGRKALDELRHLMGVLRPGRGDAARIPQPGVEELPRLVEELGKAGVAVSLHVDRGVDSLPVRLDLSIYRIVQEALTNVIKHAGSGATATVSVRSEKRRVFVEIDNDGVGAASLPGSGHGIAGMRERAQILGGTLEAGETSAGGFRVRAILPVEEGKP